MNPNLLIDIEEFLNGTGNVRTYDLQTYAVRLPPNLIPDIDGKLSQLPHEDSPEDTLYTDAIKYIKRLGNKEFLRKNDDEKNDDEKSGDEKSGGQKNSEVKEARFYEYACIDKSSWSNIKHNIKVKKQTVLKLALALELSEKETRDMLAKIHEDFDANEFQDRLIMALIDLRNGKYRLDVDDIIEVLAYYQEHGPVPFDSIYDTPQMIAARKKQKKQKA